MRTAALFDGSGLFVSLFGVPPALLTPKELANALRKNRTYVYAMKARGFLMPGGVATLEAARSWLVRNPCPRSKRGA
jgi:hypothetical protein